MTTGLEKDVFGVIIVGNQATPRTLAGSSMENPLIGSLLGGLMSVSHGNVASTKATTATTQAHFTKDQLEALQKLINQGKI